MKKFTKIIKNKIFIGGGLTSLAFLSCLTIGFASRNYGNGNTYDSADINVGPIEVVNGNLLRIDSFSTFKLANEGIVNDNNVIIYESTIVINFSINNYIAYNGYVSSGKIKLSA